MIAYLRTNYLKHMVFNKLFYLCACCISCLCIGLTTPAFANTTSPSNTVPFVRMEHGQYTIEVQINDSAPLKFMIDTAASRTSIFEKTKVRLGFGVNSSQHYINGMTNSGYRPGTTVDTLSFGKQVFKNHNIVILKDWQKAQAEGLDGILGMDVLNDLVLAFSHISSTVKIRKKPHLSKSKYNGWKKIRLEDNPYPVEKFGLLYTYTQFGDLHIPTLFDTGSNFSAINWMSVKGTKIAKERRRLREEWIVQGSIDEFKPHMRVEIEETHIGGMRLRYHEFIVMNFEKFPVNKFGTYPLVIAGIDIIDGRDFMLDLANDYLYIAPKSRKIKFGKRSKNKNR